MNLDQPNHALTTSEVLERLKTSEEGLSRQQAEERKTELGRNVLQEQEQKGLFTIFINQVNNPVIYLLLGAVAVSFAFSDIPEAIAIIVVIILNTGIGFWMEYKAQTSLKALKQMDPLTSRVMRDGDVEEIEAEDIVPGDIIQLEAGDLVPADARLLDESELSVDESALTGESLSVNKDTEVVEENSQVADRKNMIFKGTSIATGKATAVVVATGMHTELGSISKMVSEADKEEIPINTKLRKLARRLIWAIVGLSTLFFVLGWIAGKKIYLLLQTSIAWTIAAIPEGLPIVASISLGRGMLRLARRNVLVRNLAAVETLGETTVILTDKTGTITRNKLTLDTIDLVGKSYTTDEDMDRNAPMEHFHRISDLCNDAEKDNGSYQGDPLDVALLQFSRNYDDEKHKELQQLKRIHEDPFDSEEIFMATIHEYDKECYIAAKGSTSVILDACTHYQDEDSVKAIDDKFRKEWIKKDEERSTSGLKVIGFAYRTEEHNARHELQEQDNFLEKMVFVGIGGFIDPVRDGIAESIDQCHRSGIRVVMVTGDHPQTALTIARKINLVYNDHDQVVHGKDLKNHPDISHTAVFARVDPAQKLDIVDSFQQEGAIVGMTGDGVNDAPALKKADIGIAMGQRGTQVAREVSEMILKDDSFPSILEAIRQGRVIFGNIRKFIIYQLSYHLAEIVIIASVSFTLFQLPLLPLQLLFLNLLSDVFPALALGIGKGSKNVMEQPPKDPDEPIITKKHWMITGVYGVVISIYVIASYLIGQLVLDFSVEVCNNIAFFALAFGQLVHVFDMRDPNEPIFDNQVTRNKYIWIALLFCSSVLMAAYFIPGLSEPLSFVKIPREVWMLIAGASILPLLTNQVIKNIWKL